MNSKEAINEKTKEYIKELAKETSFRPKDIQMFYEDEIITGEKEKDLEVLKLIARIYFSNRYIKRMLSYLSKDRRKHLIVTCEMSKPEAHVYTYLKNNNVANVKQVYRKLLIQLKQFYGISERQARRVISKISRKWRMQRYYMRKKKEE